MNNCCYYQELIQAEIDRENTSAEKEELHAHLRKCGHCCKEYESFLKLDQNLNSFFSELKEQKLQYTKINPFKKISSINYWKSRFKEWGSNVGYCLKVSAALAVFSIMCLLFVTFIWNFSAQLRQVTWSSPNHENRLLSPLWFYSRYEQEEEFEKYYFLLFEEGNGRL